MPARKIMQRRGRSVQVFFQDDRILMSTYSIERAAAGGAPRSYSHGSIRPLSPGIAGWETTCAPPSSASTLEIRLPWVYRKRVKVRSGWDSRRRTSWCLRARARGGAQRDFPIRTMIPPDEQACWSDAPPILRQSSIVGNSHWRSVFGHSGGADRSRTGRFGRESGPLSFGTLVPDDASRRESGR